MGASPSSFDKRVLQLLTSTSPLTVLPSQSLLFAANEVDVTLRLPRLSRPEIPGHMSDDMSFSFLPNGHTKICRLLSNSPKDNPRSPVFKPAVPIDVSWWNKLLIVGWCLRCPCVDVPTRLVGDVGASQDSASTSCIPEILGRLDSPRSQLFETGGSGRRVVKEQIVGVVPMVPLRRCPREQFTKTHAHCHAILDPSLSQTRPVGFAGPSRDSSFNILHPRNSRHVCITLLGAQMTNPAVHQCTHTSRAPLHNPYLQCPTLKAPRPILDTQE
ncbi:hypothetical protein Hypma_013142 [Hypsizygus marmoreus]|uniref:Uncharacterized protein n=1 Tax=Hypsizygus marmoreus TaxID=39966 RepID=A0A369JE74_HYPMA|nr:hypothetical protein Hypma_013142 [Hypsizygus marmoreus]